MKQIYLMILLVAVCAEASAATKEPFTCEMIKEKSVRASCIESRTLAELGRAEAANTTVISNAAKEKEKTIAIDKNKEFEDFIAKSKTILTKNYKDPSSAQFTNLVISDREKTNHGWRALCGYVNGKNSYGGYVGAKMFYVQWKGASDPDIWTQGELSGEWLDSKYPALRQKGLDMDQSEMDIARSVCGESDRNVLTPIK